MERKGIYKFYYEGRFKTEELLSKYLHALDSEEKRNYSKQIGDYMYEFKIVDDLDYEWRVLRSISEIQDLMQKKNMPNPGFFHKFPFFTKRVQQASHFQDQPFEIAQLRTRTPNASIPDYIVNFFQIHHTNIQMISSFKVFKKIRGFTCLKRCENFFLGAEWQPKTVIITRQGTLQINEQGQITDFLKFDLYFSIQEGMNATGLEFGVALYSAQRKVVMKFISIKQFLSFLYYLIRTKLKHNQNINYLGSCRRCTGNNIQFIVDAEEYYEKVAKQIDSAASNIFMCGWWISPELHMIRPYNDKRKNPYSDDNYYRLDNLLKRRAQKGVKINIVVFLAPSVIPNDSDYTKQALANLHENITVERHPHEFLPKLWSHHEKAVIIDQKVAFMGGLDLCYGRYDNSSHPVDNNNKFMYPGIDYNNVRIKDFVNVDKFDVDLQDRALPRMPWHDVAFKVTGKLVADVANHFIEYWNFTVLQKNVAPIVSKTKSKPTSNKNNMESGTNLNKQAIEPSNLLEGIVAMANDKQKRQFQDFIDNKNDRNSFAKTLRTEWRKKKFQLYNGPGENCLILSIQSLGLLKQDKYQSSNDKKIYQDELQLLRSASQWSIGLQSGVTERSIQNAYLSMIKNAKKFIYIENQFFISATGEEKDSFVQNQIANALYERIKKAVENKQKFRVVVFMPLLPGMEGELTQSCPISLKLTMFWQYNTICRNQKNKLSLLQRVEKLTENHKDYIQFYALRNHGVLMDNPVTQLIYIHTKLMIVDDNVAICGSANINDRSQQGNRDSQLAVIFIDGAKDSRKMDGKLYKINLKAHSLRSKLFMEHFHMTSTQAQDPLNDNTIQLMRKTARKNTQFYRDIFGCVPDDNVAKLSDVRNFEKLPNEQTKTKYMNERSNVKGHAVQFPTKFLSSEKLYSLDYSKIQDIFT